MRITVKWRNGNTGQVHEGEFAQEQPLKAAKIVLLTDSGWANPSDAGNYVVKKTMDGPPLDESQSLEALGVNDGDALILMLA